MKPLYIISVVALLVIGFFVFNKDNPVSTLVTSVLIEKDSKSLIADSSLIIVGRVETIQAIEEASTIRNEEKDIYTIAEVSVEKYLLTKEAKKKTIYIKTLGGTIGNKEMTATDWPHFEPGERVLLFLHKDTASDYYLVSGLRQGKYGLSDADQLGNNDEERAMVQKVFGKDMTIAELKLQLQ
jgi:hypothetical protein